MSINIQSTLNTLKNQALQSILSNININFNYVKADVLKFAKSDTSSFESLLNLYKFRYDVVSSSQVSASYLLSYLDFYSLYTIVYANYSIFNNLQSAALNKYLYIYSLYQQMFSTMGSKNVDKNGIHSLFVNFLSPSSIDIPGSQLVTSTKNSSGVLKYINILTLPIAKTKTILPKTIYITDNDKSIHSTYNKSALCNLDYTIARKQFNKISLFQNIVPLSATTSYSLVPQINGTIFGYIGTTVYFAIDSITHNSDGSINTVMAKSSTNNTQWSTPYQIYFDKPCDIIIENDELSGLSITLTSGYGLAKQDAWKILLKNIYLDDPTITAKVNFGIMEQISYIKCSDVSRNPLEIGYISCKNTRYSEFYDIDNLFIDELDILIPVHSQIDELKIEATQNEPYMANTDGSFSYDFDFKLDGIKAIINEYQSSGSIAFNKESIENINDIRLNLNYVLENEEIYNNTGFLKQKMFIENSIIIYNNLDKIEIPILHEDASDKIAEYVKPFNIDTGSIASIRTRFPFNSDKAIKIYNVYTGTSFTVDNDDIESGYIQIHNYNSNHNYIIEYYAKESSSDDIVFNVNSNIYYGYYKDINNKHCLAIRSGNSNTAFTGTYAFSITMESIDLPYMSPIIYEYSLVFN